MSKNGWVRFDEHRRVNWGERQGPYAPPSTRPVKEHPQYESPGAASDGRTLLNGRRQYAILVAWGKPDADQRHAQDIARVYWTLRNTYGVPFDNIVVLYGDLAKGKELGPYRALLPPLPGDELPEVSVDGPTTEENFLKALGGDLFKVKNQLVRGGNRPRAGDQLLIYNTGHGEEAAAGAAELAQAVQPDGSIVGYPRYLVSLTDGFDTSSATSSAEAASTLTDPDGTDLLQISTRRLLSARAQLVVNGTNFGSLAARLVTNEMFPNLS